MATHDAATSTARDDRPMPSEATSMSDAHTQSTDEPNRDETTDDEPTRDDTAWYDLLGFQRDLLLVAAEVEGEELPKGLTLKERLEARYSGPINHGRLYSNLGDLEDEGLIESERFDGRTNAYRVTDRARELLAGRRDAIDAALDAGGEES
ncbi:helix-turn-helix transcriptional regulator [Halorubrum ezzemoulense]|jgi:DNA-binding transcriptional ArsR family regulator|uniref:helix-turn-helix transcriptional regulator n=2 Tax=Halorubrum TaxID=56688 RepID=UPI00232AA1B2|nr:helix-turn-helix transcriptional regulator [Halorubrum ezzemoulense]MDB9235115.1 helix-turn-helix transcriptional regulator [Halorubrum ezzemoulense]